MSLRALFALLLLFSLLAGIVTVPAAPTLVCDMTGKPMPAVAQVEVAKTHSCCASKRHAAVPPAKRCAVERKPCCHLRQASAHESAPAAMHSGPSQFAVLTAPLSLPYARTARASENCILPRRSAPRAPPQVPVPARAPPALS